MIAFPLASRILSERFDHTCTSLMASLRVLISFFKNVSQNYIRSSTHTVRLKGPVFHVVQPVLELLALLIDKHNRSGRHGLGAQVCAGWERETVAAASDLSVGETERLKLSAWYNQHALYGGVTF